jgi:hypothetical protein
MAKKRPPTPNKTDAFGVYVVVHAVQVDPVSDILGLITGKNRGTASKMCVTTGILPLRFGPFPHIATQISPPNNREKLARYQGMFSRITGKLSPKKGPCDQVEIRAKKAYRLRHRIENASCRLKDFGVT